MRSVQLLTHLASNTLRDGRWPSNVGELVGTAVSDAVLFSVVGAFVGGYDTVHTKPLAFAAFLSAPTFAVWCLAFLNAKSGFRKDEDGVDGGMENDMNAMSRGG